MIFKSYLKKSSFFGFSIDFIENSVKYLVDEFGKNSLKTRSDFCSYFSLKDWVLEGLFCNQVTKKFIIVK